MSHLNQKDQIICIKCIRIPQQSKISGHFFKIHICYEDCGHIFWTLNKCINQNCKNPQSTIFQSKPKFGQLISCLGCQSQFYLFSCPAQGCRKLFYLTKQVYAISQMINCPHCKYQFREITCQCGNEIALSAFDVLLEGQSSIFCKLCSKILYYIICIDCKRPNYYNKNLQLGQILKCCYCSNSFIYIPCPKCGKSTKNDKFNFFSKYNCNFCNFDFEYSQCPFCNGCNYQYFKKGTDCDKVKKCMMNNCLKTYGVVKCDKCPSYIILKQDFDPTKGREQQCPKCSNFLKYYFCLSCQTLNTSSSSCQKLYCPDPKQIIKTYKTDFQRDLNTFYEQKQCKLCYSQKSNMVNDNCGHVMMCKICFVNCQMQRRLSLPETKMACLICNKIGNYSKIVKYIYS